MATLKLRSGDNEYVLGEGVTTIGRTPENSISFAGDGNVSRFHAEIEFRGGEYCLIDLNSSNGTTVNGEKVSSDIYLKGGDRIVLGNSAELSVLLADESSDDRSSASPDLSSPSAGPGLSDLGHVASGIDAPDMIGIPESPTSGGSKTLLLIAGGACLLAVVVVLAAGVVFYATSRSACDARAEIVKPEPGDTIVETTEIEIDVTNAGCVGRAVFKMNGVEFATADSPPFNASIDPSQFPELADGFDHALAVELFDVDDNAIAPQPPVMLAFETRKVTKPSNSGPVAQNTPQETTQPSKGKEVSLIEIHEMSKRLVKQFSGNYAYNVSDRQFLQEVKARTAEYAQPGYFDRASKFRDAINVAFVREQNLDAPLGYMLAMSRSGFRSEKQGADEGLWRMSGAFVAANGYNGLCGTESLSDATQNCAAKASALYMKAIVFGVFDGDVIYSAAAFGKSPQEAGEWKAALPANRANLWNSIRTPKERDQLVRFFAAGIVAENPQKFGLNQERPLSELYRLTM